MIDVPPFHNTGDPDGHFFALAFSRGRYVSPTGATNKAAFFVLYFSTSAEFAPFSYMTVSTEEEWLSYHRGDDFLRSVEYAVLRAWESHGVPVGSWTLYPRANVEENAFADAQTAETYWESRRRLCMVLYPGRAVASMDEQFRHVEPLFRHDGTTRHLNDGDPDNEEIWEAVVAHAPESPDGEDSA